MTAMPPRVEAVEVAGAAPESFAVVLNMFRMMEQLGGKGKLWQPSMRQCAAIC
jgi:hypothetical protein